MHTRFLTAPEKVLFYLQYLSLWRAFSFWLVVERHLDQCRLNLLSCSFFYHSLLEQDTLVFLLNKSVFCIVFSASESKFFSIWSEYWYTSYGENVGGSSLTLPYLVMLISLIQCAKKLFAFIRLPSMSALLFDFFLFLLENRYVYYWRSHSSFLSKEFENPAVPCLWFFTPFLLRHYNLT